MAKSFKARLKVKLVAKKFFSIFILLLIGEGVKDIGVIEDVMEAKSP